MSTMPGPLMPVKRPSVNITPRSYSFSTLKALNSRMTMRMTTAMMNGMRFSGRAKPRLLRLDPQC